MTSPKTTAETVAALRDLADLIERESPADTEVCIELSLYYVRDRETLRSWATLSDEREQDSNHGTHWVRVHTPTAKLTLFFPPHILGEVTRETVTVHETVAETVEDLVAGAVTVEQH